MKVTSFRSTTHFCVGERSRVARQFAINSSMAGPASRPWRAHRRSDAVSVTVIRSMLLVPCNPNPSVYLPVKPPILVRPSACMSGVKAFPPSSGRSSSLNGQVATKVSNDLFHAIGMPKTCWRPRLSLNSIRNKIKSKKWPRWHRSTLPRDASRLAAVSMDWHSRRLSLPERSFT